MYSNTFVGGSGTFHADFVSKTHFAYTCPYCWTKINKNGKPRKNATNIQHFHGSCGDLINRVENRGSHCSISGFNVDVVIDDDTKKIS